MRRSQDHAAQDLAAVLRLSVSCSLRPGYPTLCTLVGVDPTNTVDFNGTARPIDGIDVWPLLLSRASESPRDYIPTTEDSIVYQGRWKLLTSAPRQGWYPAGGRGPDSYSATVNGPPILPTNGTWPCVTPVYYGQCSVCSPTKPCLFDLKKYLGERVNLAAQQPALVTQLAAKLASFVPYAEPSLPEDQLAKYECATVNGTRCDKWDQQSCDNFYGVFPSPFWGNFSGPCCRRGAA